MDTKILENYFLTYGASHLLQIFVKSSLTNIISKNFEKYIKEGLTLEKLYKIFPNLSLSLYVLARNKKENMIKKNTVIQNYASDLQVFKNYIKIQNLFFYKTFENFIKKNNIFLKSKCSIATYKFFDLVNICKIQSIKNNTAVINVETNTKNISIKNCIIPQEISIREKDDAIVYMGVIITKIEDDIEEICQQIKISQEKNLNYQEIIKNIKNKIDSSRFCFYKNKGFNLKNFQQKNFYPNL